MALIVCFIADANCFDRDFERKPVFFQSKAKTYPEVFNLYKSRFPRSGLLMSPSSSFLSTSSPYPNLRQMFQTTYLETRPYLSFFHVTQRFVFNIPNLQKRYFADVTQIMCVIGMCRAPNKIPISS